MGHHKPIGGVTPFLKIQEGTWADVYKAYDASLERYVLLKVLHDRLRYNNDLAEQFAQEARLMAKVQHPNVVQILSFGEDQQQVYLTTAFIEGQSLRSLIDSHGKLPAPIAIHIAQDIARGLHAAHNQHILHRDLKPANVLIANDGQVKLTDFGLATLKQADTTEETTATGHPAVTGTPAYLAPECLTEAAGSVQSDLFALGATLIEMLTGTVAFRGTDSRALFDSLLNYDPVPELTGDPAIPDNLVALCSELLDKEPNNRPDTANVVVSALDDVASLYDGHRGTEEVQRFLAAPTQYEAPVIQAQPAAVETPAQSTASMDSVTAAQPADRASVEPTRRRSMRWAGIAGGVTLILLIMLALQNFGEPAQSSSNSTATEPFRAIEQASTADTTIPQDDAAADETSPQENLALRSTPTTEAEAPTSAANITLPPTQPEQQASKTDTVSTALLRAAAQGEADSLADSLAYIATPQAVQPGNLTVLCTPWCNVALDGQRVGAAPPAVSHTAPAGIYTLELSNPHYPAYTQEITIAPSKHDTVRLSFNDFVASVDLEILPWAEVSIDSVNYGTLPPNKTILLAPGAHTIVLKNSELGEWQGTLIVAAGEKRRQPYNLHELLDK